MCGRVFQVSGPERLGLGLVEGLEHSAHRFGNVPPRYNGAPGQDLWVIRRHPDTGAGSLDLLRWGLIPHFFAEKPKTAPINARVETVGDKPMFRRAFAKRRCILPIDGFFEWKPVAGGAKQPFAIAMAARAPFGLAGLWENWRDPATGEPITPAPYDVVTIEGVFEHIADAYRRRAASVTATYDPDRGYPVSTFVDYEQNVADEELGYGVRDFTVR